MKKRLLVGFMRLIFWINATFWLLCHALVRAYHIFGVPDRVNISAFHDSDFVVPMIGFALIVWMLGPNRPPLSTDHT